MAAAITKPLGTIVLKSTCAADANEFNTAPFVIKELNILGSRYVKQNRKSEKI